MLLLQPAIRATPDTVSPNASDWFDAIILMVYAYGGFESALSRPEKYVIRAKMLRWLSLSLSRQPQLCTYPSNTLSFM